MKYSEIISYFATKNMGSYLLGVVDVIWEKLDEMEKQMVSSLRNANCCNLIIQSTLPQETLNKEVEETSFVVL